VVLVDIINVNNVSKDYYQYKVFRKGKLLTQALKDVSFTVKKGDFFGLLGKNGAGKSTLLKILTTNLEKTKGIVKVRGFDLDKDERKIKNHISWMFGVDYDGIGWSSVEKNLRLAAYFLGLRKREAEERVQELLKYFDLQKHRKLDVWRMSTGMQGRYSLCVAMLKNPEILFLDEPLLGLDFEAKEELHGVLQQLNAEGTTIIYTDQQLKEVERLCKNIVVIDEGKKVYDGSMALLHEKYRDADVLTLRCRSQHINNVLEQLKKKYAFIADYEIVESRYGVHDVKMWMKVDGAKVLLKVGHFLGNKNVVVEQLNAGMLDLEDIFRKFLKKDKGKTQARQLKGYHTTKEKPSKIHEKYLRHQDHRVREAACSAFANHKNIDRVLKNMLSLTKDMKIASLKVIGDTKIAHLAEHMKKMKGRDKDLQLHVALAMGKIGDESVVDTLMELLLDYHTCREVLEHLPRLDSHVLHALGEQISLLDRMDYHFLMYHITKMKNKKELFDLLQLRERGMKRFGSRKAALLARYGKMNV
jgi:ABC-2 type transport system ATP-binding protein